MLARKPVKGFGVGILIGTPPRANETCATFPVEISGQQGSHDCAISSSLAAMPIATSSDEYSLSTTIMADISTR